MRLLFISIFLLFFSITFAQADKVKIPKGVTYNYAADSIVEQAKTLIRQDLENEDSYVIANKLLIVGPQLWKRFGKIKSLKEIEGGNTTFLVDNLQLKGKTAQDVEDSKKSGQNCGKKLPASLIQYVSSMKKNCVITGQ